MVQNSKQKPVPAGHRAMVLWRSGSGFTLIELMIVLALVGIVSAIAFPSYLKSMESSRRADAQSVMIAATLYMQRYYAATGSYSAASLTTAKLDKAPKDTTSAAKTYDLTLEIGGDSQSYTITATPVKTDADCGSLTLTDTGAKGVTAANGSVANCWR